MLHREEIKDLANAKWSAQWSVTVRCMDWNSHCHSEAVHCGDHDARIQLYDQNINCSSSAWVTVNKSYKPQNTQKIFHRCRTSAEQEWVWWCGRWEMRIQNITEAKYQTLITHQYVANDEWKHIHFKSERKSKQHFVGDTSWSAPSYWLLWSFPWRQLTMES